ncbi:MAG: hypothetical protein CVT48_04105 [Thermoplasmata archaeon HGW-Thermoplasmata-1]|nr:MAG: hypothetical protein CVT48_04105 [Thermoplasmata archaeon HGW-Thermoplasmata-1]
MAEFETVKTEIVEFGRNNFIEVARKKAITTDGEKEFISVSRGYYMDDNSKRWKSSITLPDDSDKREKIAEWIKKL